MNTDSIHLHVAQLPHVHVCMYDVAKSFDGYGPIRAVAVHLHKLLSNKKSQRKSASKVKAVADNYYHILILQ